MRTLKSGAKQLTDLHADLEPPALTKPGWKAEVFARRSLGDDSKVELWYLAEYFLLAWHDWHTMRHRFLGYYGQDGDVSPFPKTWKKLSERCRNLAIRLLDDSELESIVLDYWLTTGTIHDDALPSVRDVFHVIVQNHRRWHLMRDAATGELNRERIEQLLFSDHRWDRGYRLVRRLNDEAASACERLGEHLESTLRHSLRRYKHANLLVSWLDEPHDWDAESPGPSRARHLVDPGESALDQLLTERIVPPSFDHDLTQLVDADVRGMAGQVLERVTRAIAELGIDDFVEDVVSAGFRAGRWSPVGASEINLIPSRTRGSCHLLLLAVSKGDKKPLGFQHIMRQVREHLIRCPLTKAVIVLCDYWTRDMLDEHIGDLRAHHKQGVRFLFLMAGVPGRTVSPVAVDLGMTP